MNPLVEGNAASWHGMPATAKLAGPYDFYFGSTMVGGTSLVAHQYQPELEMSPDFADYVTAKMELIIEYERTILELQRELLHYKRLVTRWALETGQPDDDAAIQPASRMDLASARIINSIVSARIPPTATFFGIEDGDF